MAMMRWHQLAVVGNQCEHSWSQPSWLDPHWAGPAPSPMGICPVPVSRQDQHGGHLAGAELRAESAPPASP